MSLRLALLLSCLLMGCAGNDFGSSGKVNDPSGSTGTPPPPSGLQCLQEVESSGGTIEKATANKNEYIFNVANKAVDAFGITKSQPYSESFDMVTMDGSQPVCFAGGKFFGPFTPAADNVTYYECVAGDHWSGTGQCLAYHTTAGLNPRPTGQTSILEDIHVAYLGDGISAAHGTNIKDITIRRAHIQYIHDDAIEADFGQHGFLIQDSLFDKVNMAFAMRLRSSASGNQRVYTWRIHNNLVRLHAFAHFYGQYRGKDPGHASFFKLDGGTTDADPNDPYFELTGNTFVAGPVMSGDAILPQISRIRTCSNNTLLWTGTAATWAAKKASNPAIDNFGESCLKVIVNPYGTSAADIERFLTEQGWNSKVASWKSSNPAG